MKKILCCFFLFYSINSFAQELNCEVSVLTPAIQESNKQIYDEMQTRIRDFMNNTKWTGDQFDKGERIECGVVINVTSRSSDDFTATIQVQSRRPVYKTSYNTPMINHMDNDFSFKYQQGQIMDFDENTINSNLTATLAFYAYMIIGLDYESFSPEGGTPYFTKAQTIVNNAQNLSEKGWKQFENQKNRYWLIDNMMNVQYKPFRSCMYKYHRLGFDRMAENVVDGRAAVLSGLQGLRQVYTDMPNSFMMQFFFNAKADELVSLFAESPPDIKEKSTQLLNSIDPGHINKYNTIGK